MRDGGAVEEEEETNRVGGDKRKESVNNLTTCNYMVTS